MVKVSVIIPNYNHARFLAKRIDSVLGQTYSDFEVIILDDCSTDESRQVIEQYRDDARITEIIYNESNSGSPFLQWQKGIGLAKGKYIWIAESDDFAEGNFLERIVEMSEGNSNVGISFCNSNWIDENGLVGKSLSVYKESFQKVGTEEIQVLLRYNTIQNVSATLINAALAKKYCGNIGSFKCCGDWLFYIQVLQESNVCYTSEILNNFRWYHSNTSNEAIKLDSQIVEATRILATIKPKTIKLSKRKLFRLSKYWLRGVRLSTRMKPKQKIESLTNILRFAVTFLFSK